MGLKEGREEQPFRADGPFPPQAKLRARLAAPRGLSSLLLPASRKSGFWEAVLMAGIQDE